MELTADTQQLHRSGNCTNMGRGEAQGAVKAGVGRGGGGAAGWEGFVEEVSVEAET